MKEKVIIKHLEECSENLYSDIIKCVLYHNSPYFNVWCNNVALSLYRINKVLFMKDIHNPKFFDAAFGGLGEDLHDTECNLYAFYADIDDNPFYSKFEITPDLVKKVFHTNCEIQKEVIALNTADGIHSISEWECILQDLVKE